MANHRDHIWTHGVQGPSLFAALAVKQIDANALHTGQLPAQLRETDHERKCWSLDTWMQILKEISEWSSKGTLWHTDGRDEALMGRHQDNRS
jgi:hypothetical protein